jgi:hypothetical protein
VVVLYVDQQESVKRQMARAQLAALHNTWVLHKCLEGSPALELQGTSAARNLIWQPHAAALCVWEGMCPKA